MNLRHTAENFHLLEIRTNRSSHFSICRTLSNIRKILLSKLKGLYYIEHKPTGGIKVNLKTKIERTRSKRAKWS